MKRWLLCFLFVMFSIPIFADGLTGVLGVSFGKSKDEVISIMKEKGWKVSSKKEDKLIFTKEKGTYASLTVKEIEFSFYKDRFYHAYINFPYNIKLDDITSAVKTIRENFKMELINSGDAGISRTSKSLYYIYRDSSMNKFTFCLIDGGSITQALFFFEDYAISSEKEADEKLKKEEEEKEKSKSMSEDL